jgi:very-short-patch-repair endonuclease
MGLPAPELQVALGGASPVGIVDFYWEDFGVIGEADGLLKYDDAPDALRAEKLRQEALENLGFIVVRWTWEEIWRRPDVVEARLRNAFRRGARRRTG